MPIPVVPMHLQPKSKHCSFTTMRTYVYVPCLNSPPGWEHSFVEFDHEIFSTVILSLPLIQEGQLSVSGDRMYTVLVNHLED